MVQVYVYGVTPPVAVTAADPLELPLQVILYPPPTVGLLTDPDSNAGCVMVTV